MSNEEIVVALVSRSTHAVTSIGAATAIFYIWRCYYYRQHEKMGKLVDDFGLLWLAAAYLAWASLSIYQFIDILSHRGMYGFEPKFDSATAFLSPLNNAFFLCSFIYFEHGFSVVRYLKNRWVWFGSVAAITLFSITVNLILVANGQCNIARFIDFMYSSVTLVFLGMLVTI